MDPTEPKPLSDYFKEGMKGRRDGLGLRDNPYSAGSDKRREWNAGFCATVTEEGVNLPLEEGERPEPEP